MSLSSALTIALSAVRYKAVAVETGASGVGTLGVLTSGMTLCAVVLGLGLGSSGVQATASAAAAGCQTSLTAQRAALLHGSLALATCASVTLVIVGVPLGRLILPDAVPPTHMYGVALATGATILSGGQIAFLNGLGKIRDIAASTGLGALAGTGLTIAGLLISTPWGLAAALVAAPLSTCLFTAWRVSRVTEGRTEPVPLSKWLPHFRRMLALGLTITVAAAVTHAVQFWTRAWVTADLGVSSAGYYQAAWAIGGLYLGFFLNALSTEFFPRISGQDGDAAVNKQTSKQIELALLLGLPAILWAITLTPLILRILYTPDFQEASTLLRWQLVGDVLKLVGWSVGFLLLAKRAKGAFLATELVWAAIFVALLPASTRGGLAGLGVAYLAAYGGYTALTVALAFRRTRFILSARGWFSIGASLLLALTVMFFAEAAVSRLSLASIAVASTTTVVNCALLFRLRNGKGTDLGARRQGSLWGLKRTRSDTPTPHS